MSNPAVFATSGSLWDDAWEALRQDMVLREHYVAPDAWDNRMESKACPGEVWMLDGTFYGDHTCALTGIRCVGWFHNFRHRCLDQAGRRRTYRYYLSRVDPRKVDGVEVGPEAIPAQTPTVPVTLPIHQKYEDSGEPF